MCSRIASVIVFLMMITGSLPANCDDKTAISRVLVLPFDGTSASQYSYLTDSVGAMIASRLVAQDNVVLVDHTLKEKEIRLLRKTAGDEKSMATLLAKLQADYVVTGALYALQTGLQIQVTVSDLAMGKEAGSFAVLADSENRILPAVEELSRDISIKVFGSTVSKVAESAEVATGSEGLAGFMTEHPEKKYKKGIYGGGTIIGADGGQTLVAAKGVRRSSTIPSVVVSMAVGDLDGDRVKEIVFATRTAIEVYRFDDSRFLKLAEFSYPPTYKIHAVNIADLDEDGKAEIYVSANDRLRAASSILTWSEQGEIQTLAEGIEWFLRPVTKPGEGTILAGQRANRDPERGYVGTTVSRMKVYPGFTGIREEHILSLPKTVRLFDFEWADIDGDGSIETVAIDRRQKLLVYDDHNSLIWVSTEDYGGSRNFIGPPGSKASQMTSLGSTEEEEARRVLSFVPSRILVADINGDGRQDIIVGKNKLISSKWLSNTREYDGGAVACLAWQDSTMAEVWRTNNISGFIADYGFVDAQAGEQSIAEGTGQRMQLYIGQVPSRAFLGFMMERESKILRYDLDLL